MCVCPAGFALKQDGKNCEDSKFFLSAPFSYVGFRFLKFVSVRFVNPNILMKEGFVEKDNNNNYISDHDQTRI